MYLAVLGGLCSVYTLISRKQKLCLKLDGVSMLPHSNLSSFVCEFSLRIIFLEKRMIGWSPTCRCRGMIVLSKQMGLILCRVWIQVEINWLQHHILLSFMLLFGPTASILDLSVCEFFAASAVLLLSHWYWSLRQKKNETSSINGVSLWHQKLLPVT